MKKHELRVRPAFVWMSSLLVCTIAMQIFLADVAAASEKDRKDEPAAARRGPAPDRKAPRPGGDLRARVDHLKAAIGHLRAAGMDRQADEAEKTLLRVLLQAFESRHVAPPAVSAEPRPVLRKHPSPPPVPSESKEETSADRDISSSEVHQSGNGNWNNKLEIHWQNVTHVHHADKKDKDRDK